MGKTYRKRHTCQTKAAFEELISWRTADPWWDDYYENRWRNPEEMRNRDVLRKRLYWTADQSRTHWWKGPVKEFNSGKARAYYRNELAKVYRDYGYHPVEKPYNKFENRWNWD